MAGHAVGQALLGVGGTSSTCPSPSKGMSSMKQGNGPLPKTLLPQRALLWTDSAGPGQKTNQGTDSHPALGKIGKNTGELKHPRMETYFNFSLEQGCLKYNQRGVKNECLKKLHSVLPAIFKSCIN